MIALIEKPNHDVHFGYQECTVHQIVVMDGPLLYLPTHPTHRHTFVFLWISPSTSFCFNLQLFLFDDHLY